MKSAKVRIRLLTGDGTNGCRSSRAFTLIELMIVVAILGIVTAMGVPAIYRVFHKDSLRKAVSDIMEVCSNTRTQAILRGEKTELWFYPADRRFGMAGASTPNRAEGGGAADEGSAPASAPSALLGAWSDRITLEMLDVNFIEYKDWEKACVRFYPNGTSDEMTIVLRSDQSEYRKISLECTTGLATVEVIR